MLDYRCGNRPQPGFGPALDFEFVTTRPMYIRLLPSVPHKLDGSGSAACRPRRQRISLAQSVALSENSRTSGPTDSNIKILSDNRSAGHNYHLLDRYEAGMVLVGTEVKAAKDGKIQLKEAYAEVTRRRSLACQHAHISEYSHGNIMNHPPVRKRKLLLHKSEIEKLRRKLAKRASR